MLVLIILRFHRGTPDRTIHSTTWMYGGSFQSHTSEHVLDYVLEELDIVLIMSVNPGFGGQSLITRFFDEKIRTQLKIIIQLLSKLMGV